MRSTLSFRGVYEDGKESYQKTPKVLANLLSKMESKINKSQREKMTYHAILEVIDRAHRSSPIMTEDDNNGNVGNNGRNGNNREGEAGPRPIFVKFTTWKMAEYMKSVVITYNKNLISKGKSPSVFVDNMYSKHTNERRKTAYKELKSLRDSGLHVKMFIKYPATLMVMNNETGKYVEHSTF